jgi:hypothetical protein
MLLVIVQGEIFTQKNNKGFKGLIASEVAAHNLYVYGQVNDISTSVPGEEVDEKRANNEARRAVEADEDYILARRLIALDPGSMSTRTPMQCGRLVKPDLQIQAAADYFYEEDEDLKIEDADVPIFTLKLENFEAKFGQDPLLDEIYRFLGCMGEVLPMHKYDEISFWSFRRILNDLKLKEDMNEWIETFETLNKVWEDPEKEIRRKFNLGEGNGEVPSDIADWKKDKKFEIERENESRDRIFSSR